MCDALTLLPPRLAAQAGAVFEAVAYPGPPEDLDEALARFPLGAVDYGRRGEPKPIARLRRRALPAKVYIAAPPGEAAASSTAEALDAAGFRLVERTAPGALGPFADDFTAMATAEVCLLVLAEGLDAPELFEAGWFAANKNKRLVILRLEGAPVPPRAARLAGAVVFSVAEAIAEIDRQVAELRRSATGYGRDDAVLFSVARAPERVSILLGSLGFQPVAIPTEGASDSWDELVEELTTPAAFAEASSQVEGVDAASDALLVAFEVNAEAIQASDPGELVLVEKAKLASALESVWVSGRREAINALNNPPARLSDADIDALGVPALTQLSIEFEDTRRVVLWVELEGEEQRQTLQLPEGLVHGCVVVRIATALETMLRAVTGADSISADACNDIALEAFEASLRF